MLLGAASYPSPQCLFLVVYRATTNHPENAFLFLLKVSANGAKKRRKHRSPFLLPSAPKALQVTQRSQPVALTRLSPICVICQSERGGGGAGKVWASQEGPRSSAHASGDCSARTGHQHRAACQRKRPRRSGQREHMCDANVYFGQVTTIGVSFHGGVS